MQTLDEALKPYAIVDPTAEELSAWKSNESDLCGKNYSLIADVANNVLANRLIWFYMETRDVMEGGPELHAFLLSIFAHGVVVGVAMERQEIEGVK